ncbi:MAG: nucleotidyltransferase family protein [Lachnospiraceae bacterium]|nr:nucleotidyltransferase family protein [Lachnospiraceae bacterium]
MLDNSTEYLFYLCRKSIYPKSEEKKRWNKEDDFKELRKNIAENNLTLLLHRSLKSVNADYGFAGEKEISEIDGFVRYATLREFRKYQAIRLVNEESKKRNLKFVFFKGVVLADLYPQYTERVSCDSDILVTDEEKDAAEQLLRDCGYTKDDKESKKHVQVYINRKFDHTIELHTRLWEDYEGPRVEVLKSLKLSSPQKNIKVNACGIEVYTLAPREHLIYQLFHVIKHFSLNGIGVRYLIDITLFINKNFDEIDFKQFWKEIKRLGYTCFTETFFMICVRDLKMTDKVFESHPLGNIDGIEDLKMDLLNVGNIMDKEAGWQIMGAMESYFTGEAAVPKSKLKRQISMMFPSVHALPKVYGYAIKHPILLPVAWTHRGVKFLIKKQFHKDDFYDVGEKIGVGERRMKLIEELELTMKEE